MVLVLLCMVGLLSGCTINGTRIVFKEPKVNKPEYIFQVNEATCSAAMTRLFMANYRNLYGKIEGINLWKNEEEAGLLEEYVKEITLSELSRMFCMNQLATKKQLSLNEKELSLVQKAAKEYYNSLSKQDVETLGVTEESVKEAYCLYAVARHLYSLMTAGIDEEVSDDEARVIHVMQIVIKEEETALLVQEKLLNGEDFSAVASTYNQAEEIERTVAREEFPQEVENIAFNLDNGAISEMIPTEENFYFVKCINKLDEDLTDKNKENIRDKRRREMFEQEYQMFVENSTFILNEENWNNVRVTDLESVTTDSFFDIYEKYL